MVYKKVILSLLFLLTTCLSGIANEYQSSLIEADSLFKQSKYKEAYQVYDSLFKEGYASNSMLLKMAFIDESRERPEKAIVFLSILENRTGSDVVSGKVMELAGKNDFEGHETKDLGDQVLGGLQTFLSPVLILIVFMMLFISVIKNKMVFGRMIFLLSLLVIAMFLQFANQKRAAIVAVPSSVYEDQSLASSVVDVVDEGDKVEVKVRNDFWNELSDGRFINSNEIIFID